ncbi:ABC transporter permease [Flavihumibacter petaseus]|uniref:ABC transporter permease protein n=1 Tax=Flavihumibacter petaseus NBRC 106054 TaxID=1220578 RepID=A0A0E9N6I1_9BACT|nr:ABC transporter permease [Flavihumibacter petaseus]GAO44950.1 hypothetical protein FPE01S_04_01930 [Flavihumibacter petaseus NBRC 106054]
MRKLLWTEWLKMRRYPAFWLMLAICILSYPGINFIFLSIYQDITKKDSMAAQVTGMLLGEPFSFPEAWHTIAYFSSWFIFIPSILVIMIITNEFTYRTHRQNIIDGWSRKAFITAKALDVILISLLLTFIYFLVALVIGNQNSPADIAGKWSQMQYAGLFALQTTSQLSLAFLTGLLVRKAFIAMGLFLFYGVIFEPVLVGLFKYKWFKNDIGRFFPMEISDRILTPPAFMMRFDEKAFVAAQKAVPFHIALSIGLLLLTWALIFLIYRKRDL